MVRSPLCVPGASDVEAVGLPVVMALVGCELENVDAENTPLSVAEGGVEDWLTLDIIISLVD